MKKQTLTISITGLAILAVLTGGCGNSVTNTSNTNQISVNAANVNAANVDSSPLLPVLFSAI